MVDGKKTFERYFGFCPSLAIENLKDLSGWSGKEPYVTRQLPLW